MAIVLSAYNSIRSGSGPNEIMFRWTRDGGDPAGGWHLHDSSGTPVNVGVTWNIVNGSGTPIAGSAREFYVDYTTNERYLVLVALDSGGANLESSNEIHIAEGGASTLTDDPGAGSGDTEAPTAPEMSEPYWDDPSSTVYLELIESTDNVGVDHYDIHRATTPGFTPGPGNLITVTDPGGAPEGVVYRNDASAPTDTLVYYRAFAVDSAGNKSAASNEVSVYTGIDTTPPTPPTLSLTPTITGAELSWSGATDNVGVVSYEVHFSTEEGFTPTSETRLQFLAETSFTDLGLPPGTYYYAIIAIDQEGNKSAKSNEESLTIPESSDLNILMVVHPTISQVDLDFKALLESFGYTVTTREHTLDPPSDLGTYNLVVMGQSVQSNQVYRYDTVSVPVLSPSLAKWPHSKASTATFTSSGDMRTSFWFLADAEDINAPLVNTQTIYSTTPAEPYRWVAPSSLPASCTVLAGRDNSMGNIVALAYDEGALLADGVTAAPSRRIALPFADPARLSAAGVALLERAITWAARAALPPGEDTTPPTTPGGLTAQVRGASVALSWAASSDVVGVVGYEVHRGATSGFTPDSSTLLATTATVFYQAVSQPSGTHYYKVIAVDAADNKSAAATVAAQVAPSFGFRAYEKQADGSLVALVAAGIWDGDSLDDIEGDENGTYVPPPDPDPVDPWEPGDQPFWETTGRVRLGNPAMTTQSGTWLSASDVEYINKDFTGTGSISIAGNNVRLSGCRLPDHLIIRGTNVIIEDSDIGAISISGGKFVTIRRNRIGGSLTPQDSIHITSDTGRCQDILIENNYIGHPNIVASSHYDGLQVRGVDRLIVRGNYFDAGLVFNDRGNSSIFLQDANGLNYDVEIRGNWSRVIGYNHTYLFANNLLFVDNIFYRTVCTDVIYARGGTNQTFSGNTYDNGVSVDAMLIAG